MPPSPIASPTSLPVDLDASPCSNCKRWKKACTFDWLHSHILQRSHRRRRKNSARHHQHQSHATVADSSVSEFLDLNSNIVSPSAKPSSSSGESVSPPSTRHSVSSYFYGHDHSVNGYEAGNNNNDNDNDDDDDNVDSPPVNSNETSYHGIPLTDMHWLDNAQTTSFLPVNAPNLLGQQVPWTAAAAVTGGWATSTAPYGSVVYAHGTPFIPSLVPASIVSPSSNSLIPYPIFPAKSLSSKAPPESDKGNGYDDDSSIGVGKVELQGDILASSSLSDSFGRTSMSLDLLRIYNDSMENALCCWLTEFNCPYSISQAARSVALPTEWGSRWSNRVCRRVCQLDRNFYTVRGRRLTSSEDKAAARALNSCIVAFASQWTRRKSSSNEGKTLESRRETQRLERSVREHMWKQAQHDLLQAMEIPSVRVVFASVIYSLMERPLNVREEMETIDSNVRDAYDALPPDCALSCEALTQIESNQLRQLFDSEGSCTPAEGILRQLLSFHYRYSVRSARYLPHALAASMQADEVVRQSHPPTALSMEDWETFNLLFWLGVMSDTLSAAMHQRPAVVADEDADVACLPPIEVSSRGRVVSLNRRDGRVIARKLDIWGDYFLHADSIQQTAQWPCSYQQAAEILSDITPVKVLMFRRVLQLQSLLHRGAEPEQLERTVDESLEVYQHWETTYAHFLDNCIAHHDSLPMRLQSWYIILAGHWHYAILLLAEVMESIEQAGGRPRYQPGFIATMKRYNALKICRLTQLSLKQQELCPDGNEVLFHDSVVDGAFLNEPWTAVLTRSFVNAGYVVLNDVDIDAHLQNNGAPCEYPWRLVVS